MVKRENFNVSLALLSQNPFKRRQRVVLHFQEANIAETKEFLKILEDKDFKIIDYLYNFFNKHSKGKINKKIFYKYFINDFIWVLDILKKTYVKSLYDNSEEITESKKQSQPMQTLEDFINSIDELIAYISPKMSLDPESIEEKYTIKGLMYWLNKYLYREREKTEDGRKQNSKSKNKAFVDANEDYIKQEIANIDKYLNKNINNK